jgi:hypothetical protein
MPPLRLEVGPRNGRPSGKQDRYVECPLRVKSCSDDPETSLPVYSKQRTSTDPLG